MLNPSQKPISTRSPSVLVEYDCRGERKTKEFEDSYAARRFYCSKLKAGRNPKVKAIWRRAMYEVVTEKRLTPEAQDQYSTPDEDGTEFDARGWYVIYAGRVEAGPFIYRSQAVKAKQFLDGEER